MLATDCFDCHYLQAAELAAELAAAVSSDNSKAEAIFISGASGKKSGFINGFFDPTGEKSSDGRVIYKNRFDPSIVIEHFGGKWQIKPISVIGKNLFIAEVSGGCSLEACKEKVWQVANNGNAEDQLSLKMVTGSEAESQASVCLIIAFFSMPPLLLCIPAIRITASLASHFLAPSSSP